MTFRLSAQVLFIGGLGFLFAREADLESLLRTGLEKYSRRDFAGAVEIWRAGLKSAHAQQDPLFEGSFHGNLGIGYIGLKMLDEAERHLNESIRLARENNDRQGEKNRLNTLGGLQVIRGQFKNALTNLDLGLEIAIALEDKLLESDIRSNLGLAHIGLRQYEKARAEIEAAIAAGDEPRKNRDRERLEALKRAIASTSR